MKILYIVPAVQHPTMRGALRHYHFLRALSQRHSITLLALSRSAVTPGAHKELAQYADKVLIQEPSGLLGPQSPGPASSFGGRVRRALQTQRAVRKMRELFLDLVRRDAYDLVLFHGKDDVYPLIEGFRGLPLVVDFCDATSTRMRQSLRHARMSEFAWRLLRLWQVRRIERKLLRQTPHLAFISYRDRDAMLKPGQTARVIPNGVDLSYWTRKDFARRPNCIVFTGVMNYPPNTDGALYLIEKVVPLVRRSLSPVEVFIVGRDAPPVLLEAARKHPDINVTGSVADLRPYLELASVFVAPLRIASGLQNKVLEAFAMEVPVVTTPVVAAGLRVEGAEEPPLLIARTAEEFAGSVVRLLKSEQQQSGLATAGRRFVESHFDWARSAAALEEMCLQAVARANGRHEPAFEFGDAENRGRSGIPLAENDCLIPPLQRGELITQGSVRR